MGVERNSNDVTSKASIRNTGIDLYQPPAARKLATNTTSTLPSTAAIVTSTIICQHNSSSSTTNTQDNRIVNTVESVSLPILQTPEQSAIVSSIASSPTSNTKATIPPRIRERRPDRAVYVPRARRSQTTPPSSLTPLSSSTQTVTSPTSTKSDNRKSIENTDAITYPGDKLSNKNFSSNRTCDHNKSNNSNTTISTNTSTTSTIQSPNSTNIIPLNGTCQLNKNQQNYLNISTNNCYITSHHTQTTIPTIMPPTKQSKNSNLRIEDVNKNTNNAKEDKDRDEKELQRATKEINRSNRRIIKQTFNSDVLEINDPIPKTNIDEDSCGSSEQSTRKATIDPETDDWDSMFDDNGDCLDPKLLDELTASVGKVKIEKPISDYKLYHSKQAILNAEEFPHVLEISNFPVEFKTPDLMMLFSPYKESGFDIKWVDDTHALAIFSSAKIAAEVLSLNHPFVLLKPLTDATLESRTKAKKCSSSLQPYRQRPETCAALARRLVTGALGVRLKTAREELENERKVLREAKERKLLAAKQRDEAWEN